MEMRYCHFLTQKSDQYPVSPKYEHQNRCTTLAKQSFGSRKKDSRSFRHKFQDKFRYCGGATFLFDFLKTNLPILVNAGEPVHDDDDDSDGDGDDASDLISEVDSMFGYSLRTGKIKTKAELAAQKAEIKLRKSRKNGKNADEDDADNSSNNSFLHLVLTLLEELFGGGQKTPAAKVSGNVLFLQC